MIVLPWWLRLAYFAVLLSAIGIIINYFLGVPIPQWVSCIAVTMVGFDALVMTLNQMRLIRTRNKVIAIREDARRNAPNN